MGKIRVKVVVLPSSASAREEVIAPWIEPCSEDNTLQELCDKIVETFADLHAGKGNLDIKRVLDFDGNILSCRLTVGEAFVESQNIADRTVKVVRLPPDRQESDHPLRFASIAPNSSARPQPKRSQAAGTSNAGSRLTDIVGTETWVAETTEHSDGRASKRQRLQDARPRAAYKCDPPLFPSVGREDRVRQRPQSIGLPSVQLVEDSLRSPGRKEQDPYGTPLSLSVQSPFYLHSSRRDDVLAIPDSPDRGLGVHSNSDNRTISGVVAEKAKSESPELTASVHNYPSSRSPEDLASSASLTLVSPQRSSRRPLERARHTASPLPLGATRDILQGRPASTAASSPFTSSSSHRGYRVMRNTQQHWSGQIDLTEINEGLSEAQRATNHAGRGERGNLPGHAATTSNSIQHPDHDDYAGGQWTTRPTGVIAPPNSQTRQLAEVRSCSPNSQHIQGSASLAGSPKSSLVESPYHFPGRLPTLARSLEAISEEQPRQRMHENVNLNRGDRGHPEEGEKTRARDLDSNAPPVIFPEKAKAQFSANVERVHAAGTVEDLHSKENQPRPISNLMVADTEPCLQTPVAEYVSRDEALRVENNASPHNHGISSPFDSEKGHSKAITSDERGVRRYGNVVALDNRIEDKGNTSSAPSLEILTNSQPQQTANATKEDVPAELTATARPSEDQVSQQKKDDLSEKRQVEEDKDRKGLASATKIKSKANEMVAPASTQESFESLKLSSVQSKKARPGNVSKHRRIDEKETSAEPQAGEPKITKDHKAEEKLRAEERAKREADAVARSVAAERRNQRISNPGTAAKRSRTVSKQVDGMVSTDVAVQRLLGSAGAENQLSSSPSIHSESIGKRRSMTPLFPSSLKPSKGALRTSESSGIRRSVSFNDDPIAPPALLAPAIASSAASKVDKDRDAADVIRNSKPASNGRPRSKLSQSKTGDNTAIVQNDAHMSGSKQPAQQSAKSTIPSMDRHLRPKTQTKLNITRDVKLKGRAQETPTPQTPAKRQDIVISSDSENSVSMSYSDEEDQTESAKAGPSKKRKLMNSKKSAETPLEGTSQTVQQPKALSPKPPQRAVPIDVTKPVAGDVSTHSRTPGSSRSRSPAQYMTQGDSGSQGTGSESDSSTKTDSNAKAASESGSQSGSQYESESGSGESASESELARSVTSAESSEKSSRGGSEGIDIHKDSASVKLSNGSLRRPSKPAVSRTHSPKEAESDGEKQIANELDQQLQREHRQSIQASQIKSVKVDMPTTRKEKPTPTPASANKPNNSRFPSLTGLRGRASRPENTATQTAKTPLASKVGPKPTTQPLTQKFEEASVSESDDESSSSDDEDNTGQSSQNSSHIAPKPQSGPIRGIRELIRVSRKLYT